MENEINKLKVGCKITLDTINGARIALITGWRWPYLSVDPVSVMLFHDDGSTSLYTFNSFAAFRRAYRGKYSS